MVIGEEMKEKIAEMLYQNLGTVYCYSCEHEDTNECDYCDRKSMGWSLSRKAADGLAEEIMKIINEG